VLTVLDHVPRGMLDTEPRQLHRLLTGPTLMHLPGRRPEPLFVSVLLHGNEDTGYRAIQRVLAKYAAKTLPRAITVMFGNIAAARAGMRRLPVQPDYNRIWPGAETDSTPEHAMARDVVESLRKRQVFAAIDIHNNSGLNPNYACVNTLEQPFLHLARLFSRTVVFFQRPLGVVSAALAKLCPAVVIECGQPGQAENEALAADFVEAALHLSAFPAHPLPAHDVDLYHTIGTVTVPDDVTIGYGRSDAAIRFADNIDHLNFRELASGTRLAQAPGSHSIPLVVTDEAGRIVTEDYLALLAGEIVTRRAVMPAMLTRDERVIRQDCLCYFMERLPYPGSATAVQSA
jgi:succinylglutamate desuccinylase